MDAATIDLETVAADLAAAKEKLGPEEYEKRMAKVKATWAMQDARAKIEAARAAVKARYEAARAFLTALSQTTRCADELNAADKSLVDTYALSNVLAQTLQEQAAARTRIFLSGVSGMFAGVAEQTNEMLAAELCKE